MGARCTGLMELKLRDCFLQYRKSYIFGVTVFSILISAFKLWELTFRLYS